MFKTTDPRVFLLVWVSLSFLAMIFHSVLPLIGLAVIMVLLWIAASRTKALVKFTIGLVPFLVIISLISLFPSFDYDRAVYMGLRYYVLLGSTILVMNFLSYGDLTNAFRNLKTPLLSKADTFIETFSFLFGLAFLTVPMTADEWSRMKEIQKTRGIDIAQGSKIQQVRAGLGLISPLVLRVFDRIKNFSIAVILYGYNPFAPRSQYRVLTLSKQDKQISFVSLGIVIIGVILALTFRV
jgi:energy-coupling factor transport system permease protein